MESRLGGHVHRSRGDILHLGSILRSLGGGRWDDGTQAMQHTVTIHLDSKLDDLLNRTFRDIGRTREAVVLDALRRHLAGHAFEAARRRVIPHAEALGIFTDEDVFRLLDEGRP